MSAIKIKFEPLSEGAKFFPPKPVKAHLPSWFKNMDSSYENLSMTAKNCVEYKSDTLLTIKRCVPVLDYMTSGYSMFSPLDAIFSITHENNKVDVRFFFQGMRDGRGPISFHPHWQFPIKKNGVPVWIAKFYAGWRIKTPKGYSSLIYPNFYNFEERFTCLPAIVDTDTHDDELGFIAYIDCSKPQEIKIEAGTPLVTVFPFKREEWEMEIGTETINAHVNSKARILSFNVLENMYRKFLHTKKRYD